MKLRELPSELAVLPVTKQADIAPVLTLLLRTGFQRCRNGSGLEDAEAHLDAICGRIGDNEGKGADQRSGP